MDNIALNIDKAMLKHCEDSISDLALIFSGEIKIDDYSTWAEIVLDGPDITITGKLDKDYVVTLSVLVASKMNGKDIYFHKMSVARALDAFTRSISDDNVCMNMQGITRVKNYGLNVKDEVTHSVISATYKLGETENV